MTKREKEKIEREKLKNMLADNPKLKEIIDNMIDNPNPDAVDAVKPIIEKRLSEQRMIGMKIGFQACLLDIAHELTKVESMEDVDRLKDEWNKKAEDIKNKLGLTYGTIEEVE